jgi:hypothetical protein
MYSLYNLPQKLSASFRQFSNKLGSSTKVRFSKLAEITSFVDSCKVLELSYIATNI